MSILKSGYTASYKTHFKMASRKDVEGEGEAGRRPTLQGLGTQVLNVVCWWGPEEASGSHWRLGKTELLGFSFVLGSAHPFRPDSQPALYGERGTGKSTDTQKSWDKPMTECESPGR